MNQVFAVAAAFSLCLLLCQCGSTKPEGATPAEHRAYIDRKSSETLEELAKTDPESKAAIDSSEGYAVFQMGSGKLPLFPLLGVGAGKGYGVAVDNTTDPKDTTYMKASKYNWGWGMGFRDDALIFAFDDRAAFEKFRSGKWITGPAMEATAKKDDSGVGVGGTATVKEGYKSWTLTETGVSYGITYDAYRYRPDKNLNE